VDQLAVGVEQVIAVAGRADACLDIPRHQVHRTSAFVGSEEAPSMDAVQR